jgi:hypothetical protein
MDFLAVILVVIACFFVWCYEGIIVDLIGWASNKWQDRKDRRPEDTN